MVGGGPLPADLGHEALPVGPAVAEGQKHGRAESRLGAVIDEGFLGGPGHLVADHGVVGVRSSGRSINGFMGEIP
jgi:hypothetical protein